MTYRRPPQIAEDKLQRELDELSEDDDHIRFSTRRTRRKSNSQATLLVARPPDHPSLSDFGPNTIQKFFRERIELAIDEGRQINASNDKGTKSTRAQPQKKPRPGFQRPLFTNKRNKPRHNAGNEASEESEEDAGPESDHESRATKVRQRPRRRQAPCEEVFRDCTEELAEGSNRLIAEHEATSPQQASGHPVRRSSRLTGIHLKEPPADGPSFSSPANITKLATAHLTQPPARSGANSQKLDDVVPRSGAAVDPNTGSSRNTTADYRIVRPVPGNADAYELPDPSEGEHTHLRGLDKKLRTGRSLRNVAFEEHVNEKRRSRREDDELFRNHQTSRNHKQDDEDSPRIRKPPSRFNQSAETPTRSVNGRGVASTSGLDQPGSEAVDRAAVDSLVEGLWNDLSAGMIVTREPQGPSRAVIFHDGLDHQIGNPLDNCAELPQYPQPAANLRSPHSVASRSKSRAFEYSGGSRDSVTDSGETLDLGSRLRRSGRRGTSTHNQSLNLIIETSTSRIRPVCSTTRSTAVSSALRPFNYNEIVPEALPKDLIKIGKPASNNMPMDDRPGVDDTLQTQHTDGLAAFAQRHLSQFAPHVSPLEKANDGHGVYPRDWSAVYLPLGARDPPMCRQTQRVGSGWPSNLSIEVMTEICKFLAHDDVRNLRLVNRAFADLVAPISFRSVVTKFGRSMFDITDGDWDSKTGKPPVTSMFQRFGHQDINRFGISFEIDLQQLQWAPSKVIQQQEQSWFGDYVWPVPTYPRFPMLQSIEDLVDHNRPLLKDAMSHLLKASELALSVDSGHGWLNGPDLSDMAVYNSRCSGGTPVFGKAFLGNNKWHDHGRDELLKWAQQNTLNESIKAMQRDHQAGGDRSAELRFLQSVVVRDLESFRTQRSQPDRDLHAHTGGGPTFPIPIGPYAALTIHHPLPAQGQLHLQAQGWQGQLVPQNNHQGNVPGGAQHHQHLPNHPHLQQQQPTPGTAHLFPRRFYLQTLRAQTRLLRGPKKGQKTQPQWPIVFSGHNVAAEVGGHCDFVESKLASPFTFPFRPGQLTEAQAQWLMETVWAQRAFLSAYTTSIITNRVTMKGIHSLHIAKLSSGLLPSLAQHEFWAALPSLKTLKVLVSPDWRIEHTPGDRSHSTNMLISPVQASAKFAEFLNQYIAKIEHLSVLTIGFVGGGEHAPGIFARNQNILPAPITTDPRAWVTDHKLKPDAITMMRFDHIRELRFENCWFSPSMLEVFMIRSRDTSLRHLTLESVSLAGVHLSGNEGPMTTADCMLHPLYGREAWLNEKLPNVGCWASVLDRMTPGQTFLERRIAAGLPPVEDAAKAETKRGFRGNVDKIILKSVGYLKISGITGSDFNQNALVVAHRNPMDEGVQARKARLEGMADDHSRSARHGGREHVMMHGAPARDPGTEVGPAGIMMSRIDPKTSSEYFGLGKLTQCIHPVEKRVLEQAWGMTFGWGDAMERWATVEDGCFEGGTGRFSGVIAKTDGEGRGSGQMGNTTRS